MSGISTLPATEIAAWLNITGERLSFTEIDILRKMDAEYCRVVNEETALANKQGDET